MSGFFDSDFWKALIDSSRKWLISEFPGLLLALLFFFLALKFLAFSLNRLKKILVFVAERNDNQDPEEASKRVNTLVGILHSALRIILWTIFIMIIMQKIGIDIAPLLAGAGILGLAIGFGAQELVRDFISGFFIILENQIRSGDVAIINGTSGLVEKIGLRTISLRDLSGVVHIFQNGKIDTLSNMTKEWSAIALEIGVAYKEDINRVMQVMREVGEDIATDPLFRENILEPIEIMGLDQFAGSSMIIKARIKTRPSQQWTIGREYRKRLKYAFDRNRIEIPFPHTTVYWGERIAPLELKIDPAPDQESRSS